MPPRQVRLKVPPKVREEEADRDLVVQAFVKAIAGGVYDTHLDILFAAVDGRIQESQQEPGDAVEPRDRVPEPKLADLVSGRHYFLSGDKYAGVVVKYLDVVYPRDGDGGISKVKVECISGNYAVTAGKFYKLPATALVDIPGEPVDKNPERHQPVYGYSKGNCRSCGGAVEYNGRGRPPSVCEACKKLGK